MENSTESIFCAKIRDLFFICLALACALPAKSQKISDTAFSAGADRPELYIPLLIGKRVAVATNQTGRMKDGTYLPDYLLKNKIRITKIFAPEHGFRGEEEAGATVKNGTDTKTGLPVISLYGKNKKPTTQQLRDVDVILFDIQDVGVRFYTYISTLSYLMEAAAENHKKIIVLDRPNPNDGIIDGPLLQKGFESFVGLHQVPVIYGLTIGEYGEMINGEKWIPSNLATDYTLIPMKNYHKKQNYNLTNPPSPNLANLHAIHLYPSLCFFEGTQISVGRGTDYPFEVYGSPYTPELPFKFIPKSRKEASAPPFMGENCFGEDLRNVSTDFRGINLEWLLKAYKNYKNPAAGFFLKNLWFDKLAGTDTFRRQVSAGLSEKEIWESWQPELEKFKKIRAKYVVYPD